MCMNCREEPDTPPPPVKRGRTLKPVPLKARHEHEWTFNETHLEMVCVCGTEKQSWLRGGS